MKVKGIVLLGVAIAIGIFGGNVAYSAYVKSRPAAT